MATLTKLACMDTYGVQAQRIKAWRKNKHQQGVIEATVECKAHAAFKTFPVYSETVCERATDWSCAQGNAQLAMTMDGHKLQVALGGFAPEVAYQLINKAMAAARFRSMLKPEKSQCALSKGTFSELINIDCDSHQLVMSTWCPQSTCPRIYAIDGVHMGKE